MTQTAESAQLYDLVSQLKSATVSNYGSIRNHLVGLALANVAPTISGEVIIQVLEALVFPVVIRQYRGWSDSHVGLSLNPPSSMGGITAEAFVEHFDRVFVTSGSNEVSTVANQIKAEFGSGTYRTQLLSILCDDDNIVRLFYFSICGYLSNRSPIAVMTSDPCAGALLAQLLLSFSPQDGSYFEQLGLQTVSAPGGGSSANQFVAGWTSNDAAIRDGAGPEFTSSVLEVVSQWIDTNTSPAATNPLGVNQDRWVGMLKTDSSSMLSVVVKVNQQLNLNKQQQYTLPPDTSNHTLQLGASYERKLKEANLEYDVLAAGGSATSGLQVGSTGAGESAEVNNLLSIKSGAGGKVNDFAGSQILLNSDRIVINTRSNYLMLFGGAGVSIASPNSVHIDSDSDVTLFGEEGVFLGLPNKGEASKSTGDQDYEPLVLGDKLANLMEDLIVALRNATILTPAGSGFFKEDTLHALAQLQARLPEMLSTYAFVDGKSHEPADPPPAAITSESTTNTDQSVVGTQVDQLEEAYNTITLYQDSL